MEHLHVGVSSFVGGTHFIAEAVCTLDIPRRLTEGMGQSMAASAAATEVFGNRVGWNVDVASIVWHRCAAELQEDIIFRQTARQQFSPLGKDETSHRFDGLCLELELLDFSAVVITVNDKRPQCLNPGNCAIDQQQRADHVDAFVKVQFHLTSMGGSSADISWALSLILLRTISGLFLLVSSPHVAMLV